jgi:long-chain acyl-CoA synthetase
MGIRVIEGYGTTECSPVVTGNTYWERCPGSVGRPLEGVDVEISDDGEILVRGPIVFAGYWDAPEATAAAIDATGRFHTGDLGSVDDEGRLHIEGRASERIVLGSGLNVYPEDVERELLAEPEIAHCAVVDVPDADGNARIRAVVVPATTADGTRAERSAVDAAVRRAASRLAPHQRPTGLSIWPDADLPRTALLKVR